MSLVSYGQALIEKDWLAFGHMFADRLGTPTYSGVITMAASESGSRQIGPSSTSPGRLSLDSSNSSADSRSPGALSDHYSPIFLQVSWIKWIMMDPCNRLIYFSFSPTCTHTRSFLRLLCKDITGQGLRCSSITLKVLGIQ